MQPWNMVEMLNVSTMTWSWVQAPYGWSYNSGTGLPGTASAMFAGGGEQTPSFLAPVSEFQNTHTRSRSKLFYKTLREAQVECKC